MSTTYWEPGQKQPAPASHKGAAAAKAGSSAPAPKGDIAAPSKPTETPTISKSVMSMKVLHDIINRRYEYYK
jgi:hypothetical protein